MEVIERFLKENLDYSTENDVAIVEYNGDTFYINDRYIKIIRYALGATTVFLNVINYYNLEDEDYKHSYDLNDSSYIISTFLKNGSIKDQLDELIELSDEVIDTYNNYVSYKQIQW